MSQPPLRAEDQPEDRSVGGAGSTWSLPRLDLPDWTLLTNHAHVLLCIHNDPTIRVRDIATLVGITERAAHKIVADLSAEGYVTRTRVGRRNQYTVDLDRPLRHPLERHHRVGELLALLAGRSSPSKGGAPAPSAGEIGRPGRPASAVE